MLIGVDNMCRTRFGFVIVKIPAAACAVGCFRLQYAEGVFACFGVKNAADARGKIRSIRFKAPFAQCGFKASARRYFAGNGVRLVAVGNDGAAVDLPHGRIDDKRRVCQLFFVERPRSDAVLGRFKYAVAAVLASAHDEVCGHIMCVVRTFSDKHAASGIGIAVQVFVDSFHLFRLSHFGSDSFVHCLFHCSVDFIDKNTCSSARGSNSHSACSITRRCKVSGVSPGSTSTAFCMIISPPSATAFT